MPLFKNMGPLDKAIFRFWQATARVLIRIGTWCAAGARRSTANAGQVLSENGCQSLDEGTD